MDPLNEYILREQDKILVEVQEDLEHIWSGLLEHIQISVPFLNWNHGFDFLEAALNRQGLTTEIDAENRTLHIRA